MRWEDERYIRLYTRDTVGWRMLPWQAKALLPLLMRKVDRAGILDLDEHGVEGLAAIVELPEEVVHPGLDALLKRGTVQINGTVLFVTKFLEAQEAQSSDAQRKRDQRERAAAREKFQQITGRDVTQRDETSQSRTGSHTESLTVTSSHSVPSLAVPSLAKPSEETDPRFASATDLFGQPEPKADPQPAFDFDAVYRAYPRKLGRKKGLQRCRTQIKTREKYDALLRAVGNYTAHVAAERTDERFIKHFDSFMSCWEDWVDAARTAGPRQYKNFQHPAPHATKTEDVDL